jgi:hypothetical protein
MKEMAYNEITLERVIKAQFGVPAEIKQMIVCKAPVGRSIEASLFLTDKKQLYLYIDGQSKLTLGDVKKIIIRMGLKAEVFIPPKGRPSYFNDIAVTKFTEVFPGRKHVNDGDIAFYKTLVPYNPALVLISEVRDGHIYQYDADSADGWRMCAKFAYRRIKTS